MGGLLLVVPLVAAATEPSPRDPPPPLAVEAPPDPETPPPPPARPGLAPAVPGPVWVVPESERLIAIPELARKDIIRNDRDLLRKHRISKTLLILAGPFMGLGAALAYVGGTLGETSFAFFPIGLALAGGGLAALPTGIVMRVRLNRELDRRMGTLGYPVQ